MKTKINQGTPVSVANCLSDKTKTNTGRESLDAWLDDERFFAPFRDRYHRRLARPSVPAEIYLRMIALKHQYGLSNRQVCALVWESRH